MNHRSRGWVSVVPFAALSLLSCGPVGSSEPGPPPARVERVEGSDLSRVILTGKAAERLDVQTAPVMALQGPGGIVASVPYGAVLYDASGSAWVYTVPETLTYVRHAITLASIEGQTAYLTSGPAPGTQVVSVGAAELFGTEFEEDS